MSVGFDVANENLLKITDEIEGKEDYLYFPSRIDPVPIENDAFQHPVDRGIQISSRSIYFRKKATSIQDETGQTIQYIDGSSYFSVDDEGKYTIDIGYPIKTYIQVESTFTIKPSENEIQIDFGEEVPLKLGSRSYHRKPHAKIKTTKNPIDMMIAVSQLGSSLKTTTCERSYPTLRGHPPSIELGESLEIPDCLEVPETGIEIGVPPDYGSIFTAAPLAYYLAADVVSAETPYIRTESGFRYNLVQKDSWEKEIERVLKKIFFLDCLTRTEGFYQVDLYEREKVEEVVDVDFEDLYSKPVSEQVEKYLNIPYGLLEPYVPEWQGATYLPPEPENIEMIPKLANELSQIRSSAPGEDSGRNSQVEIARGTGTQNVSFNLMDTTTPNAETDIDGPWREHISHQSDIAITEKLDKEVIETVGKGEEESELTVIIASSETLSENKKAEIERAYSSVEGIADINIYDKISCPELVEALSVDCDFFHFIGEATSRNLSCSDDSISIPETDVGARSFLLDYGRSYEPGMELINSGSESGIITKAPTSDITSERDYTIGPALVKLLNHGFPLRNAIDIASGEASREDDYIIVGDGNFSLANDSTVPLLFEIEDQEDHLYDIEVQTYITELHQAGTILQPYFEKEESYLAPGTLRTFEMDFEELNSFTEDNNLPLKYNGSLYWPNEIDLEEVLE